MDKDRLVANTDCRLLVGKSVEYEGGSVKSYGLRVKSYELCCCYFFNSKLKTQNSKPLLCALRLTPFNLHNSNFILAFYSPRPTAFSEGATFQSRSFGEAGRAR